MPAQYVWTLTGGELQSGNAQDATQTDQFNVYGIGNYIVSIGGNLIVNGGDLAPYGEDSETTIILSSTPTDPASAIGVTDTITLDGGDNALTGSLTASTVTFTVNGTAGDNVVSLDNAAGGTTTISMGGAGNGASLNGDATNSVTSTGGTATVTIGSADDNLFGYSATVTMGGTGNTVTGGDEDVTVSGGQGSVTLGDGTDSVSMTGSANDVTVGGGNDMIDAGSSDAVVSILGVDGTGDAAWSGDADDGPVPISPTDNVIIAGTKDKVTATYENVNIIGLAVAGAATISLGDGNNSIILSGTGGNKVTVGNGANLINAGGSNSTYTLGDGSNSVTLSGNSNTVTIKDPTGVGADIVQLGAGTNDSVSFSESGGSVTGTATTGTTTVSQSGPNRLNVTLSGTGKVTLGNGSDKISVGGAGSTIKATNGNDTVTANGASDTITLGNGADAVTANGAGDKITLGKGASTLTANGDGDTLTLGNGNNTITANGNTDTMTFGSGSNTLSATGSDDQTVMNAISTSKDNVTVGASDNVWVYGGTDTLQGNLASDNFYLDDTNAGTTANVFGNSTGVFLGNNASALIMLNPAALTDLITVQSMGGSQGTNYAGSIQITGFGQFDEIDLQSLTGGVTNTALNSFASVLANMSFTPTGDVLSLAGGGSIKFISPIALTPTEFVFTPNQGPFLANQTPCFCRGMLIRTDRGEVAVEALAVGDRVMTASGETKPIVWIGRGKVPLASGDRCEATPIIVREGALADNVPYRDLHITKGHSLYLDGVLVPVEFLVNHRSILWDDSAQVVEFYHIELATHDVLIANGAPAESYRDDGNRWLFQNANSGWNQPSMPACTDVLTGGPIVDTIWRRLLDRAGPRPDMPLTDDPDLYLLVDGRRVNVARRSGGCCTATLPADAAEVRLMSRAGSPAELGLMRDPRRLGVAVRQIRLWRGAQVRVVAAADPMLQVGFHGYEPDEDVRWTNGDALLPQALFADMDGACELEVLTRGTTQYPRPGDVAVTRSGPIG